MEPLSPDLQWTAGSAAVAAGVLTMDRAIEATRDALPRGVASSVDRYLARWTGAAPPLGRDWLRDAISGPLTAQEQAAAELALWVVVAPARVTTAVVDRARPACPDDRWLFGLVAWSSWRAARRVATWLAVATVGAGWCTSQLHRRPREMCAGRAASREDLMAALHAANLDRRFTRLPIK